MLAPLLKTFVGGNITLDGTGTIATSQWQSFNAVSLTVNGGAYTLGGLNSLIAPNLYVNNGASLTLPAVTSITAPNGNGDWHLYAADWGSTLSLPNLTTIGTLADNSMDVTASFGGEVLLPALTTVTNSRPVQFEATNGGSLLDLSSLASFSGFVGNSALTVTVGGTVLAPLLTSFTGVNITLDGTGAIATSQWQSFNAVNLTINSGSYTLGGLNSLTAPSLNVNNGASLTLPAVSIITAPAGNGDWHLFATDPGSTLNLPALTTISTHGQQFHVHDCQLRRRGVDAGG